jgi:hypothetical protein
VPKAAVALVIGTGMLLAVFSVIERIAGWVSEHGAIAVYAGLFLWFSIAGRLFWWAIDTLITAIRTRLAPAQPGTGHDPEQGAAPGVDTVSDTDIDTALNTDIGGGRP